MKGIKPETFIHAMEEEGIYLSTKSACSTSSLSNAIYSIYHDNDIASSSIRISLSGINWNNKNAIVLTIKLRPNTYFRAFLTLS